jgi:hypothetical protein
MDPLSYIIIFFFVLAFVVLLPLISGVGSYKYQRTYSSISNEDEDEKKQDSTDIDQGYVPLEEQIRREQEHNKKESKFSKLKNLKITKESIPLKFTTTASSVRQPTKQALRNRKPRNLESLNNNPDSYDYDLDELINEEEESDENERREEFEQIKAKSQNDLEDLA